MKVLIVTHYWLPEYGPDPPILVGTARWFRDHGIEVDFLASMPSYPTGIVEPPYRGRLMVRERVEDFPTIRTWTYSAGRSRPRNQRANELSFGLSSLLALGVLRRRYDWVISLTPPLLLIPSAWVLSRLLGARWALHVMDLDPQCTIDNGALEEGSATATLFHRLARFGYERSDLVIASSQGIKSRVEDMGVRSANVHFVPNGIDTDEFRPLARRGRTADGRLRAALVGSMSRRHDVDSILRTASLLRDQGDTRWEFQLVGAGNKREWAEKEAAARGLSNVQVSGPIPREQVPSVLAQADVVLVSLADVRTNEEHIPTKLYDAMACGRPVLLSGRGEPRRIVEAAGAGIVVEPEDPAARVRALRRFEADPAQVERFGTNGRRYALRHYSRPICARQIEQLLRETRAESR